MSSSVARVQRTEAEALNITSVYFSTSDGSLPSRFPAGSFGMFRVVGSKLPFKPYSISTAPTDPELGITIDKVGSHSAELATVRPGEEVAMRGPFGHFTLPKKLRSSILLIAGGIGITPLRSLVRQLAHDRYDRPVALLHSAQNPDRLIFHQEFTELATSWASFSYLPTITDPAGQGWAGHRGRFTSQAILEFVPDAAQRLCYLCGSQAFVEGIRATIVAQGVSPKAMRIEQWVRGRSDADLVQ